MCKRGGTGETRTTRDPASCGRPCEEERRKVPGGTGCRSSAAVERSPRMWSRGLRGCSKLFVLEKKTMIWRRWEKIRGSGCFPGVPIRVEWCWTICREGDSIEASGWSLKQPVLALKEVQQSGLKVKALMQLATKFLRCENLAITYNLKMESIIKICCTASIYPSSGCAHESAARLSVCSCSQFCLRNPIVWIWRRSHPRHPQNLAKPLCLHMHR